MNVRRLTVVLATVAVLAVGGMAAMPGPHSDRPATKVRMVAIFEALSSALNLSLYDSPFAEPENREMIQEALDSLAANATELDTHGGELNPSFGFLPSSLARDAHEAILRYRQQQYAGVGFVLDQLVEKCVACHTKLPDEDGFDLGRRFVERARIERLPREQRLRLLVATRQFDKALGVYEARFKSSDEHAQDIAAGNALCEYLKLTIRVSDNPRRAAAVLSSFRKRREVTGHLAEQMDEWIRVITDAKNTSVPDNALLDRARALVQEGQERNRFPADRMGTAHFVIASSLLQRYLEARPRDDTNISEAFYLLGACESHTERSRGASETEFYLESAIRADPATPHARLAFELLEEYVTAQYSGSAGVLVPDEVRQHFDELRGLIDGAR